MSYRDYGYESQDEMADDVLTNEELNRYYGSRKKCPECGCRGGEHVSGCPEGANDED